MAPGKKLLPSYGRSSPPTLSQLNPILTATQSQSQGVPQQDADRLGSPLTKSNGAGEMAKEKVRFIRPGHIAQQVPEYERQRREKIDVNNKRLTQRGLKPIRVPLSQTNKDKTQQMRESENMDDSTDDDDDYQVAAEEENLSSNDDAELPDSRNTRRKKSVVSSIPEAESTVPPSQGMLSSKRVRGKTTGKGIEKLIAQNGGEKLLVPVLDEWENLCGINAPKVSSLLGVYLRRMCPIKDTPTWWSVDPATQSAIIQAVLDKFKISDDFFGNQVAQKAVHMKCYRIHITWRYNMKRHYKLLVGQGLDAYAYPYDLLTPEDWRYMIDEVWATKKHQDRSQAAVKNRAKLEDAHTVGSRSFAAEMTIPPDKNGSEGLDFPEFYEKVHTTKKEKQWTSQKCAENHEKMLKMRQEAIESGKQVPPKEMSTGVLGKRKRYILGFGAGPKPLSSTLKSNAMSRARDEELLELKSEMEKVRMEREEEKREREEEKREREEERRARDEAQMKLLDLEKLVATLMQEKTQTTSPIHHARSNSSTSG